MSSNEKTRGSFTQRVKHELIEFWMIALYLMFFFCALVTYTMLLLKKYEVSNDVLNYGFAVMNALVIGKVILVGEMMRVGRGYEKRPLYQSVLLKSIVFAGLVLVFHILEETVKRVIAGKPFGTVWHHLQWEDMVSRALVIFCAFVPLFAFREIRRVLGEEKLYALLRGRGVADMPDSPVGR
ncbi:hypothetical protein [Tunturiibacter gelidoferens]|uniref:Magnesium-transporting ATPase (P-type) n=1 Tax=Tunturiibacter lichenicola TaxID=2051959 RepID=A0A7Y9NI39_9BACT|nr:hypothetical protein [Edaphobacter lichenicola]NYF49776.1 magnesium-transporting ATPase (P-type) [Edaphobacter lichenicola]